MKKNLYEQHSFLGSAADKLLFSQRSLTSTHLRAHDDPCCHFLLFRFPGESSELSESPASTELPSVRFRSELTPSITAWLTQHACRYKTRKTRRKHKTFATDRPTICFGCGDCIDIWGVVARPRRMLRHLTWQDAGCIATRRVSFSTSENLVVYLHTYTPPPMPPVPVGSCRDLTAISLSMLSS